MFQEQLIHFCSTGLDAAIQYIDVMPHDGRLACSILTRQKETPLPRWDEMRKELMLQKMFVIVIKWDQLHYLYIYMLHIFHSKSLFITPSTSKWEK